jgi:uncharacterized protein
MSPEARPDDQTIGRAGQRSASAGLLELSTADCWAHLRGRGFGRLALVVDGVPRVFPMNYATAEDVVVFRTEPGAKLRHGPGSLACLEVDGYDPREALGWSVMATGRLEDITDADDERSVRLRGLPLVPSAPGERRHWLALEVTEVSGRFFRRGWLGPSEPNT